MEKGIIINDLHVPYHDTRLLDLVLNFAKEFKPNIFVINGDMNDMFQISSFDKNSKDGLELAEEINVSVKILDHISNLFSDIRKIFIFGNHEYRFDRFIWSKAPELNGLKGLSLREQLMLDELEWDIVYSHTRESYIDIGHFLIGHFDKANKYSAYTAKNLIDRFGKSLVQAHTHRGGVHYRSNHVGVMQGIENFCMCRLNPPYILSPDWQHGFTVFYQDKKWFQLDPIFVNNYKFIYQGEHYG